MQEAFTIWFLVLLPLISGEAMILPSFSWDPKNPMFKGNVCGGNEGYAHINVQEHSVIHFLCPSSPIIISVQNKFSNQLNMYENMFQVSKKEFDSCQIDSPTQKSLLDCDSPKQSNALLYRRFSFSSFTSSSMQFFPNQTYYFIATSNGSIASLNNRAGGRCSSDNMRLAVTVCASKENCINDAKHLCRTPKTTPTTTTTTTTTTPTTTTTSTTTTTENNVTPHAQPKKQEQPCSKDSFGVTAVACLIGGLFAGIVLGFCAVLIAQKYTKRFKKKKRKAAKPIINKDPARFEDNQAYRFSMEGKRLLSTSSNASSERYSVVPPVVPRVQPPPGTVAV